MMSNCTCPSGDGSLRWPCLEHPPTAEPATVKPSVEAVEQAIRKHDFDPVGRVCSCGTLCGVVCDGLTYAQHLAHAVHDLLPGRTEAEVKAEALRLAAHDISLWNSIYREFTLQHVVDWLRERADFTEREG